MYQNTADSLLTISRGSNTIEMSENSQGKIPREKDLLFQKRIEALDQNENSKIKSATSSRH